MVKIIDRGNFDIVYIYEKEEKVEKINERIEILEGGIEYSEEVYDNGTFFSAEQRKVESYIQKMISILKERRKFLEESA